MIIINARTIADLETITMPVPFGTTMPVPFGTNYPRAGTQGVDDGFFREVGHELSDRCVLEIMLVREKINGGKIQPGTPG